VPMYPRPGFDEVKSSVSEPIPIPKRSSFRNVKDVRVMPLRLPPCRSPDGLTSSMISSGGRLVVDVSKLDILEANLRGIGGQIKERAQGHDMNSRVRELNRLYETDAFVPRGLQRGLYKEYGRVDYRNINNREEPLGSFWS